MWREASYSLPILFGTEQSLNHLKSLKEISRLKFHHNLPIQNIYGSPSDAVWNGGRNLENAEIRRFFEGDVERYFGGLRQSLLDLLHAGFLEVEDEKINTSFIIKPFCFFTNCPIRH